MRDIDLLYSINAKTKCVVQLTLTTFDEDLCRIIVPDVSTIAERFEVLEALKKAEIPIVVWLTPTLPFINDTEENLRGILDYCIRAGVRGIVNFGFGTTMREGSRVYFYKKLDEHFPRMPTRAGREASDQGGMRQRYIETYNDTFALNASQHVSCENCLYHRKCKHKICPHIMENLDDLRKDGAFVEALANAESCDNKHRQTLVHLKNMFNQVEG